LERVDVTGNFDHKSTAQTLERTKVVDTKERIAEYKKKHVAYGKHGI
jgi:hypothetical protein